MNAKGLADRYGVSGQAVTKAARSGQLDGAIRWEARGARRTMVVTDLELADRLWLSRPGARAPALERARASAAPPPAPETSPQAVASSDPLGDLALSRLERERYQAKLSRLEFEQKSGQLISVEKAMQIFGRQIQEAKSAVMALGKHARSRIPHLTVDDVLVIEELARQALEGLAVGAIQDPIGKK